MKVILWPYKKHHWYFIPHYMSCMSWSPDKGEKVYSWLFLLFAIDRK